MPDNLNIPVPSVLLDNMVRYVEVSSMTAKRAIDEVDLHRQAQKRAYDLKATLLQHMLDKGVVVANQKEAADAMLGSHAETLQLLKAAVDKIAELKGLTTKKAGDLGEGVEESSSNNGFKKQGEYNSLESPMVGQRTSFVKESDKPLLALINR